ncbi:MAG: cytidine deaminase [Bacteroidetes bacterium]|nr:cytidine deaminase [Bacteroidota bacterium]
MQKKEITIEVRVFDNASGLQPDEQQLVKKAIEAAKKAYAPYSGFFVGAALLLGNGEIIQGNNQENAAYPSGICAERVALFYANSRYPQTPISTIAVTAFSKRGMIREPVPPCGSCRQALLESELRFNTPIRLIMVGKDKIYSVDDIKSLLPLNFGNDFLENHGK